MSDYPRVLNRKIHFIPANAVYVGRPSRWGNPYRVAEHGRGTALAKYKDMLTRMIEREPALLDQIKEQLRGKDLVCWCHPDPCHADILLELANG